MRGWREGRREMRGWIEGRRERQRDERVERETER